jgi:sugar/nucleoside kinase (ribokinase family)
MPGLDLLVVGDCNPDLLLSGSDVDPVFGQVERLVDDARLVVGGSGAITACGAVRLGLRSGLVAVVGDDSFGRFMRESLAERGVDVSAIAVDAERPTGVSVVLVRGQDRAILTAPGTIADLTPEQVSVGDAAHVHVSSFFLQDRLRAGVASLFSEARAAGATTSIDPNWDPREQWDGGLLDALASTDILFVNGQEVRRIAREEDDVAAAKKLAGRGPTVVVKLGGDGAVAVTEDEVVRQPPLLVQVVDTVGAGDSFDAGFLAGFLAGRSLADALALACRCGSLSTRAAGGTAAQATLAEATPR